MRWWKRQENEVRRGRECGAHTLENTKIRRGDKDNQGRRIKRI